MKAREAYLGVRQPSLGGQRTGAWTAPRDVDDPTDKIEPGSDRDHLRLVLKRRLTSPSIILTLAALILPVPQAQHPVQPPSPFVLCALLAFFCARLSALSLPMSSSSCIAVSSPSNSVDGTGTRLSSALCSSDEEEDDPLEDDDRELTRSVEGVGYVALCLPLRRLREDASSLSSDMSDSSESANLAEEL